MLSGISWGNYLTAVAVILICYYLIIIIFYYRQEVTAFLNHKSLISSEGTDMSEPGSRHDVLAELESAVQKIDLILGHSTQDTEKEFLLEPFRLVLADLSGLTIPAWRVALYNHIISKSAEQCGVTIREEELDRKG